MILRIGIFARKHHNKLESLLFPWCCSPHHFHSPFLILLPVPRFFPRPMIPSLNFPQHTLDEFSVSHYLMKDSRQKRIQMLPVFFWQQFSWLAGQRDSPLLPKSTLLPGDTWTALPRRAGPGLLLDASLIPTNFSMSKGLHRWCTDGGTSAFISFFILFLLVK